MANRDRVGAINIGSGVYEFEARIVFKTAKAYLVEPTVGKKTWLPKSQMVDLFRVGDDDDGPFIFHMMEWWSVKAKEFDVADIPRRSDNTTNDASGDRPGEIQQVPGASS